MTFFDMFSTRCLLIITEKRKKFIGTLLHNIECNSIEIFMLNLRSHRRSEVSVESRIM
jgi:hypothetical protein